MAKKDNITVIGVLVSEKDGKRIEINWEELSEEEQVQQGHRMMDTFMENLGFEKHIDKYEV